VPGHDVDFEAIGKGASFIVTGKLWFSTKIKRALAVILLAGQLLPALSAGTKKDDKGWIQLFNGKDRTGWRNFKKNDISKGWQVMDGALCRVLSLADGLPCD